ncbi:MAG: substrate-binding domain-containing protein [Acidimicrobiales bacterium]|nr:substrate-binding domain-containing protein [Acidimicrobiales bacterium]
MTELLPPTRADRVRAVVLVLTLLAVFGGVAAIVDALGDEPTVIVQSRSTTDDDNVGPTTPSGPLEGSFLVSGSSTVYPIVLKQAEAFGEDNGGVAIAVEGPGSGDGARKFCAGEVPIANASRLYKDEEIEICEANGIEFIELRRGIDGITVITSAENDEIDCVSFNDLYALLSDEAFGFDSWADANAITANWNGTVFPDVPLQVFAPGQESGTYDSFAEIVIESVFAGKTGLDTESREFVESIRNDYTASTNDTVILQGIESSRYSLGWVGYAFAQEASDGGTARMLPVSKGDGGACVDPSPETIADASFPIARFLYTYVNAEAAATDPAVAAFVDYMLSDEGLEAVSAVGYVDLSPVDQTRTQTIWTSRLTGTGQWE